ncbi:MAG: protein-disulfide reductase DsbD [Mesorhizobium sp.]|nr:protein-disulfide reductase DsbD [Mesorhizobium sp.]MCO5164230.1 protein-disulfide reductase DsbD [Mesorhizobium sp.]
MRRFLTFLALFAAFAGFARAEPLPVDEAFELSVTRSDEGALRFQWAIADGYYLYRDHIGVRASDGGTAVSIETPAGVRKDDPGFGIMEVYYGSASATVAEPGEAPLELTYQGCQVDGICYRPETRIIDPLSLEVTNPSPTTAMPASIWVDAGQPSASMAITAAAPPTFELAADEGLVASLLADGGSVWVIAGFLLFGLLLAFTPCVFPMYPILAGVLSRQGDRLTPRRGFTLSAIYVLSLSLAFGLIGAAAGWSGQNLQMALQSPYTVGAVALVFVALALSMFGLFELQLPSAWTSWIAGRTGDMGGSKRSVAMLGFSSVLIVGPCVTAPLAGALLYIAQTGNVALGATALFALGIGKGIPLMVLGTLGGRALPRAGAWMNAVKQVFGFGFLSTAIWMATPLLPAGVDLALWAALLIALGAFAFNGPKTGRTGSVATRAIGLVASIYGIILLVGAASGSTDPLKPLAVLAGRSGPDAARELAFADVSSIPGLQTELAAAEGDKPTLVYFTADWCVACVTIERSVLKDEGVRRSLGDFNLLKADLSNLDQVNGELMTQLRVAGPPTMLFFDKAGRETPGTRLVGNVTADRLTQSANIAGGL